MSDLIKREDAIKELAEYLMMDAQNEWAGTASEDIEDWKDLAEHILKDIPSAENKGEWIYPTDIIGFGRCNNCKALWDKSLIDNIYFKYCPRCGARMKGADNETN